MNAARERQRREECQRAVAGAYRKTVATLRGNAEVLAGFGVAGLSGLGFVVLLRRSDGSGAGES